MNARCFLCSSPAVAVVHTPNGCTCSAKTIQPRCFHHMLRIRDTAPRSIETIEWLTEDGNAPEEWL